jgi:chemotaxis protein histidine kinase CheA
MSEGPGFLEFFILEASDYVEQLDGLLLGGSSTGPDADALQRVARALRGTATMAKLPTFADVAAAVERVGRAMQEGALRWDPALSGALVATIDDLKTLLHSARTWSPAEDRRATSRTAELARFAPPRPFTPPRDPGNHRDAIAGSAFLATEAANIAAGLELLATRAGAPDTASNLLRRVRALRGVAGVKAVAPLADVLEAIEDAARGLESNERTLTPEVRQLLETAAEYLRVISSALRFDGDFDAPSAARDAFVAAHAKWVNQESGKEKVVPISTLFYADGGSGVVEAAQNPPTSTADRFHLELVSHAEHLRQVVDSVRNGDAGTTERDRRNVLRALRDLEAAAESFGESSVADFVRGHLAAASRLDDGGLAKLDELASLLSEQGANRQELSARDVGTSSPIAAPSQPAPQPAVEQPAPPQPAAVEIPNAAEPVHEHVPEPFSAPIAEPSISVPPIPEIPEPAPAPVAAAAATREQTPKHVPETSPHETPHRPTPAEVIASAASTLIDMSLAALDSLTSVPWISQVEIPEETIVPIESLLYRGNAALDRAIEIRDELRRTDSTDATALEELFDLLELARAE